MTPSFSTISEKSGLPPGSLVHIGDVHTAATEISLFDYNRENLVELQISDIEELQQYKDSETVTWVVLEGLTDIQMMASIGKMFGVHSLVLEDILNTNQRAKLEEYDDHLYIVLKCMLPGSGTSFSVDYEQISLLVFKNFVFLFKEKKDDLFHSVQQRLKTGKGRLRNLGADFLTYTILDTVVDQHFILIDSLDDAVTSLEDDLLATEQGQNTLNRIQKLRREVISIRRHLSPLRELLSEMLRSDSDLIQDKTQIYLRDVSDHALRIIESTDSYREILTGLLDIYISNISNKMNEVMKVLTVFASIFIPLTFLVGIYGMNFEYMPELKLKWAYPFLWAMFIVIPGGLIIYFKKRKWL